MKFRSMETGSLLRQHDERDGDAAMYTPTNAITRQYKQEPVAIVGLACRLPANCNNPRAFWDLLEKGGVASLTPPESRFRLDTHHSGNQDPKSMASPGGMFLNIDPADLDAQFFKLSRQEAVSMDPQHRQLLEVVYEGLENAGITLEDINGQSIGCFISSYACDYADIQARDPEDRPSTAALGVGRAMLSNRLSHFLNIKGPSMTIDTACSGSLTALDVACRYLQTREINGAIIGGCNIYLSPEHVTGSMSFNGYASLTGRCHTFDAKADGYIKAEAANMVMIKRLDDAIRDGDPIRGIIRGTATGSDGWTAGIASPNGEAQATTIRQAYMNAQITDLSATSYVEFHGTGTKAGDAVEIKGVSSVFASSLPVGRKLRIGSVKSNIGHSEPAAGLSGLIKTVLAMEKGVIPGNPTFETPNPAIDFERLRAEPQKHSTRWPKVPFRRAGVNSFGYGGSNAHLIVDSATGTTRHTSSYLEESDDLFVDKKPSTRPYVIVLSANDESSLRSYCISLDSHLSNPAVSVEMRDLAYTLSERRTHHYHRAFTVANHSYLDTNSLNFSKTAAQPPRIGYIFTGQGAQWSEMGKELIETFPVAKQHLAYLNDILRSLPHNSNWSLLDELSQPRTPEHMRLPEFSQPLVTALQLAILAVLQDSGISCEAVVGHSSGEIAAAVAAGYLTPEQAIKIAFYRGKAVSEAIYNSPVGMLATGLGAGKVQPYLCEAIDVEIACYNSPQSVTLAGAQAQLINLEQRIKQDGHFARLLVVDAAYHSRYMDVIAPRYSDFLEKSCDWPIPHLRNPVMYSSVTGIRNNEDICRPSYWVRNMTSPVLFQQAAQEMLQQQRLDILIEIGPSDALSGPVKQIAKSISVPVQYASAWKRGKGAVETFCKLAGDLFLRGATVKLGQFNNGNEIKPPSVIVDLPNYSWNHSVKYWHESDSSKDWRFRNFPHHDLLGSKVLGTPWYQPTWKKAIRLEDLPWLRDHKIGENVVFPAAGYIAMAVEALFQMHRSTGRVAMSTQIQQVSYKLRDVSIERAMILEDRKGETKVVLVMNPLPSSKDAWHKFKISSISDGIVNDHCQGSISLMENIEIIAKEADMRPLQFSDPASVWYKIMQNLGYCYGPGFQKQLEVESRAGQRRSRSTVSLIAPESNYGQSTYPIHPASIDACFQSVGAPLWQGNRSAVSQALLPAGMDELILFAHSSTPTTAMAIATANFEAPGREDDARSYKAHVSLYNVDDGQLLFQMSGLRTYSLQNEEMNRMPHTYCRLAWKPDISSFSQIQLDAFYASRSLQSPIDDDLAAQHVKLNMILDLFAFRKSDLKVMEIDMTKEDENVWIDMRGPESFDRMKCCHYRYSLTSHDVLSKACIRYKAFGNASVEFINLEERPKDVEKFDLIIVTTALSEAEMTTVTRNICRYLETNGSLLVLHRNLGNPKHFYNNGRLFSMPQTLQPAGFQNCLNMRLNSSIHQKRCQPEFALGFSTAENEVSYGESGVVEALHFDQEPTTVKYVSELLVKMGLSSSKHSLPFPELAPKSTVVVLDELFSPLASNINDTQWAALQHIIHLECRVLWVTKGSQMHVTNPEHGIFVGLARSIYEENPSLILMTLDVEGISDTVTVAAIEHVLRRLRSVETCDNVDKEFVERGGIIHIGRVLKDDAINECEKGIVDGEETPLRPLFGNQSTVRLVSDRVGTLDSLVWVEAAEQEITLPEGHVEVDVHAVGINFKDIAVSMGLIPADESRLGLEGAGVIRRLGDKTAPLEVGQRVLINKKGALANKVQCEAIGEIFPLPNWISFEDASTLCIVYSTAFHGLLELANLQRENSVLIHSGAGGVGLAAIQLSKHLGATIYTTVGTDEKREFLTKEYGIPPGNIFSSRTTEFAAQLLNATGGKGVDCVLNSLSGEALHESWRCIATSGTFVEIGKRDIIERSSLSMEPFSRNASFRAVDMSHDCFDSTSKHNLLAKVFDFLEKGYIKPIHIGNTFGFEDVKDSFRYMRGGLNIGKTIISSRASRDEIHVPIRPAAKSLKFKATGSYLIVGGLKGLCGSLALFLARQGARRLVVLSRSGYGDNSSKSVLADLSSLGTNVDLIQGDVTMIEDVRRAFAQASAPICGIIQGAMVLRDKLYTSMSTDDFHKVLRPKVQGTWNLHNVALEEKIHLDFFTMLSSICGIAGARGQANYSAANAFLDAFASYRHSLGLFANSVSLGVIEDVGYVNEHDEIQRRLLAQGWTPIRETLLHNILHYSILQQACRPVSGASRQHLITGIPVPLPKESPVYRDIRFVHLRPAAHLTASKLTEQGDSSLALIRSAGKENASSVDHRRLLDAAIELGNEKLVKSLGMSEPIDPARPLSSYGIDSLVAVEFRNWARAQLNVEITALEIVAANTLTGLSEMILARLLKRN